MATQDFIVNFLYNVNLYLPRYKSFHCPSPFPEFLSFRKGLFLHYLIECWTLCLRDGWMLYVKNSFDIAYDKLERLWMMLSSSRVSSPDSLVCRLLKDSSPWSNQGLNLVAGFLIWSPVYLYFAPDLEFSSLRSSSESSCVYLGTLLLCEKAELRNGLKIWSHFSAAFYLASYPARCPAQMMISANPRDGKGHNVGPPFLCLSHLECLSFKFCFPWQPQALFFFSSGPASLPKALSTSLPLSYNPVPYQSLNLYLE